MKHFTKVLPLLVLSSAFINWHTLASDSNTTFKAADDSLSTKICVAAAQNDLKLTLNRVEQVAAGFAISTNKKARLITRNSKCNGMNIVEFTAKYNAVDTFDYFNKQSVNKYKMNTKITDVAYHNVPQLVIVSSK